jgi:hypothetical protein
MELAASSFARMEASTWRLYISSCAYCDWTWAWYFAARMEADGGEGTSPL